MRVTSIIGGITLVASLAGNICETVAAEITYPEKPITIVVATAAGGTADLMGRLLGQFMAERFSKPVVIENRPGAGNIIGTEYAAKSRPDGYTLFLGTSSPLTVNPAIYSKLSYDSIRDFQPVSLLGFSRIVIVANAAVPVDNLRGMIEYVRARPGKLSYATPGNGTTHHLAGELMKNMAGVDMTMIPYKGSLPALTDVISGQVTFMFDNLTTALPQVRAGKLKVFAVTSATRSPAATDIPTANESGLPGMDVSAWLGLLGPTGMPPAVVAKLYKVCVDFIDDPEVRKRLANAGIDPSSSTPEELTVRMRVEIDRYRQLIKTANIRIE